jgi:hypothetical protein
MSVISWEKTFLGSGKVLYIKSVYGGRQLLTVDPALD